MEETAGQRGVYMIPMTSDEMMALGMLLIKHAQGDSTLQGVRARIIAIAQRRMEEIDRILAEVKAGATE